MREALEICLDEAKTLGLHVLVGVLKRDAPEALESIRGALAWLDSRGNNPDHARHPGLAVAPPVCGFTVCAPCGRNKSQEELSRALAAILDLGLPTALYQLPQVTQNEISAGVAARLASQYPNFLFFKDSSGTNRVVLSQKPLRGVFTVRGGEGDYARWLSLAGGPYDGFLLGSANCFAAHLGELIRHLLVGQLEAAQQISQRLTAVVNEVFALVAGLPEGNPFANSNKAIDHFFAWGPLAAGQAPPRLHAGSRLPVEVIRATGQSLSRHGLMPAKGYL